MSIIVAGIHTGIGKSVCSAVLCEALGWDYWKPVQAGDLDNSDSIFIKNTSSNPATHIHPEAFRLNVPASPHYAAEVDGLLIRRSDIMLPKSNNHIVVETAGGLMSPLAIDFLNIDLVKHLNLPVVLVSQDYLGSINHTLLSIAALKQQDVEIKGIVFSGDAVQSTRDFILEQSGLPLLFSIPQLASPDKDTIRKFAASLSIKFEE